MDYGRTQPKLGETYTRAEIHTMLGGNLQETLPTKNGRVICACLRMDLNPLAPEIVYVADHPPRRAETATTAVLQRTPFPVFVKGEEDGWKFIGPYRALYYRVRTPELPPHVAGVLTLAPELPATK